MDQVKSAPRRVLFAVGQTSKRGGRTVLSIVPRDPEPTPPAPAAALPVLLRAA